MVELEIEENKDTWSNVGVYPTPQRVVASFVKFTLEFLKQRKSKLDILDLFAGDGRLGNTIRNTLPNDLFKSLTYLEIRDNTISKKFLDKSTTYITDDGFKFKPSRRYDLVVSNPPYLALNSKKSELMGFDWGMVQQNGKNLYGLGIIKALSLCKPGGYAAIIAPFGYLRGVNGSLLREEIERNCDEVVIRASSNRNLFEDANQDIAFQVFRKRRNHSSVKTKWKFGYDDESYHSIHINPAFTKTNAERYVRVGPIVWNRKKEYLTDVPKDNIAVIYGGNITHDGRIDLENRRYRHKQYIRRLGTIPTDIITSPFIAIRRTLRGKPGKWIVDSALVPNNRSLCTGENHTIIIELPELHIDLLNQIQAELERAILEFYFHSGSPNISTITVRKLFSRIIEPILRV